VQWNHLRFALPQAVHGARVSDIKIWNKSRECLQMNLPIAYEFLLENSSTARPAKVVKSKHLLTQRKEDFTPRDFGQVISIYKEVMPCESV
jgi:hypothetical protein